MKRIHPLVLICVALVASSSLSARPKKNSSPQPAPTINQTTPVIKKTVDLNIAQPRKVQEQTSATQLLTSIQRDLQDPRYRDILPNNFSYLVQLLDYGKKSDQNREFAHNVISLFSKLLKGSEYVNSYVFSNLIEQIPGLLKHHFSTYQLEGSHMVLASDLDMLERLEQTVSSIVYNKFAADFSTCKSNPEKFLQDLSQRIMAAATQEVSMEQLRQIVIRFLEVGLSKLVWSPRDEEKTWDSVKTISHNIATLMEYNIVDDLNDVDELFWTLVHRYRYFLELHSTDMPISFYHKVAQDMQNQKLLLFDLAEQEPFMQTKANSLMQTLVAQQAKKQAYEYQIAQPQV